MKPFCTQVKLFNGSLINVEVEADKIEYNLDDNRTVYSSVYIYSKDKDTDVKLDDLDNESRNDLRLLIEMYSDQDAAYVIYENI